MSVTDKSSEAMIAMPQEVDAGRLLVETKLVILTRAFDEVAAVLHQHSQACNEPDLKRAQEIISRAVTDCRKADFAPAMASEDDIAFLLELPRRWEAE